MKTFHTIDYSEAQRAVSLIVDKALAAKQAIVVAVADSRGELLAFARMDGAPASSVTIALNKAWTSVRARKPTHEVGERIRHPEKGFDIAYYGDPRFVGWGGGIPLWKDGEIVGSIAVSGLSPEEDAALATAGSEAILGTTS